MPDQLETQVGTWTDKGEYHKSYGGLENYPPKQLLDKDIADIITASTKENEGPILVAEVGAGPAPISTLLSKNDPERFKCSAYDLNPEMTLGRSFSFPYTTGFDMTDPAIEPEEIGKYDAVVLENSLYTVSMSPDGTRNYTPQEARLMKQLAFNKAASMLKPGGVMVLTDPITKTEDFGVKRIITFLKKEQEAEVKLNNGQPTLFGVLLRRLADTKMQKILAENKLLMPRVILSSSDEIRDMIKKSQLFEENMVYENPSDYLGSNYTAVLRRNGNTISVDPEVGNKLDSSVVIDGVPHDRILEFIGAFRKKVYAQSGTTEQLPKQDKFDKKPGEVMVYLSRNKPGIAAVATIQPRGEIGLDAEELMSPEGIGKDSEFYRHLVSKLAELSPEVAQAVAQGKEIELSEIRRLAADNLDRGSIQEFFQDMAQKLNKYTTDNKIDVILFLTEPKRAKLFNWANGVTSFAKVEGFKLNRQPEHQTMMLCAANYFFGDWKNVLTPEEASTVEEVMKMVEGDADWRDVIKGKEREKEYTAAVEKLFEVAEDNVSIYFTDYPMRKSNKENVL